MDRSHFLRPLDRLPVIHPRSFHHAKLLNPSINAATHCRQPAALPAHAHHGWSSFDLDRPIYLEGKAAKVKWANPHTELMLDISGGMKLPADLASRTIPAQTAQVDAPALLKKATLPKRADKTWEIELAPLTRMEAWKVPEIKNGQSVALLGFTFKEDKGSAILRAEFLWLDGRAYALRSSPA